MKPNTTSLTHFVLNLLFFVFVFNVGNAQSGQEENLLSIKDLERTTDSMGIEVFLHMGNPYTGAANYFNRNGLMTGKMSFLDGRQHGLAEEYYQNGDIKGRLSFNMGVIDGV